MKAAQIKAALELRRRATKSPRPERPIVRSPAEAATLLMPEMCNLEQEHTRAILLNTRNHMLSMPTIYIGNLNSTVIRVAELFRVGIRENAASLIVAHNHRSGDPAPSPEDVMITRKMAEAGTCWALRYSTILLLAVTPSSRLRIVGWAFNQQRAESIRGPAIQPHRHKYFIIDARSALPTDCCCIFLNWSINLDKPSTIASGKCITSKGYCGSHLYYIEEIFQDKCGGQIAMRVSGIPFLFALLSFILGGCSSSSQVEVNCDAFQENNHLTDEVAISAGDEFTVTLCSNPTTGYEWSANAQIVDTMVVRQIAHEYVMADDLDTPLPPGTPGVEIWTFSALEPGNTTITFDYSRPWEGGEKSSWTFKLVAMVE